MRKTLLVGLAILLFGALAPDSLYAQGNLYWQELWTNLPPTNDPGHPNYWMVGNRTYTGLAYDKTNDVIYIVNPGTCKLGTTTYKCPRIFAWNAADGTPATQIVHVPSGTAPGQLYVNTSVVQGSFSRNQYPIYRIDLDDEGRIYAANILAPIWGLCFPGPPPNCDPDYLTQGPYKVYRWDSYSSNPKLIYQTVGSQPANSEMISAMWGTSFAVVGKRTQVPGGTFDSTRIFASGGQFYVGYDVPVNDQINVFVFDDRQNPPTEFRLGVYLQHNEPGSGIAAHGLAPTGPYTVSQLYMDANFREAVLNNQSQTTDPLPQTVIMGLNQAVPLSVTGQSGAIKYFYDELHKRAYLITADGMPTGQFPTDPNSNTRARVVDLSKDPLENWPPQPTPQLGATRLNNITGIDNFISDVDYKVWINDIPGDTNIGRPFLQLFVLMSNNGIASYRTYEPLPVPVDFTTFRGYVKGSIIDLEWQIAAENNNHGFEVYRSFNKGQDWEQIGFVKGRGTTSYSTEYSYGDPISDVHENVGVVQYRLRQVDTDGKYMWTPAIDVYIGTAPNNIVLYQNYPNPFNPSTSISYQLQEPGYVTLKVFNAVGEEVASLVQMEEGAGLHVAEFNASDLPSGTYMYQLNVDGKIQQKKMVLMK